MKQQHDRNVARGWKGSAVEGARAWGVSRATAFRWLRAAKTPPVKVTRLTFTTPALLVAVHELEEGFRLPLRTLIDWIDHGLVTPSVVGRPGVSAVWSLRDLARVRLCARLRRRGISPQQVASIFAYLDRELQEVLQPKTTARLVVAGRRAFVVRPGAPDIEVPSGQIRLDLKLDELFVGNEKAARRAAA